MSFAHAVAALCHLTSVSSCSSCHVLSGHLQRMTGVFPNLLQLGCAWSGSQTGCLVSATNASMHNTRVCPDAYHSGTCLGVDASVEMRPAGTNPARAHHKEDVVAAGAAWPYKTLEEAKAKFSFS
ncbi:hypothetical protein B0T11DRAFT_283535 [Plectosphaerella cucumerina]|uniref:Uncharacterized protein n=1 Tax=Plectosphaerella cucumerina TaxID=40658 RepID=A0A8K0TAH2_9PEZI|nr:hypothetical protein B0T11DRAFT_283535 [Plectosphaerella cucumerina]